MLPCGGKDLSVYQVRRARRGGNSAARPFWVLGKFSGRVALTFGRCFLGGWLPGRRQAGQGLDYLRFLFGDQRLSVCCDVSGKRHLTADCRFLCGQKAAEKTAPNSEAGARLKGPAGPLRNPGARSGSRRELPPATQWNTVYGARYVHHKIHGHPASHICAAARPRSPAPGGKPRHPPVFLSVVQRPGCNCCHFLTLHFPPFRPLLPVSAILPKPCSCFCAVSPKVCGGGAGIWRMGRAAWYYCYQKYFPAAPVHTLFCAPPCLIPAGIPARRSFGGSHREKKGSAKPQSGSRRPAVRMFALLFSVGSLRQWCGRFFREM